MTDTLQKALCKNLKSYIPNDTFASLAFGTLDDEVWGDAGLRHHVEVWAEFDNFGFVKIFYRIESYHQDDDLLSSEVNVFNHIYTDEEFISRLKRKPEDWLERSRIYIRRMEESGMAAVCGHGWNEYVAE